MAMNINTNVGALMASAAANSVNKSMEQSMERLSTGLRINSAADDAAGSAITSRLTAEIKGTNQAIRNAMDSQAMIETAEGAHIEVEAILQRMRELAVQAANDTNGDADRANLQLEISQLSSEIDRIAETTTWAGVSLLKGSDNSNAAAFSFQIGSSGGAGESVSQTINSITASQLGVTGNAQAPEIKADFVGVAGEGKLSVEGNKISFGGKFNAGDTYSLKIAAQTMSITATTGDGYTDDAAGLAAQMTDAIRTVQKALTGQADSLSVVDHGDGSISVFADPAITEVKTQDSGPAAADAQTFVYNAADKTFTVGGTYEVGDIFSFKVNGEAISETLAATNLEYEGTNAGVVSQLVDAVNANTNAKAGGVRAIIDSDDFTKFRIVQDVNFTDMTYTPKTTSTSPTLTASNSGGTLTFANAPAEGDSFTSTINGIEVGITMEANDGYDRTATGAALKMTNAIQAKIDSGELKGVTVASAAEVVTITQSSAVTDFSNLATIDVGSTTTIFTDYAPATGILSIDSGTAINTGAAGSHDNGDTIKFSINGVDLSIVVDTTDGYHDTSDGLSEQITAAINSSQELKAMGVTATQTKMGSSASAKVTLAFETKFTETEVVKAADVTAVKNDADMSTTLTLNRSSFANGDKVAVDIEGTKVELTINTGDSAVDDKAGVAAQLKSAIEAAGINGVTVTDNGDGSIVVNKPSAANVTTAAAAIKTIDVIDAAFVTLNTQRSSLGAISNRLDSTVSNLTNVVTNLESGRARIQDADFAAESTNLAKQQILQQAATSMLAQANASKQSVLSLLQG